jgi:hypothetical protein
MSLCLCCSHYEASRMLWCSYACVVLTVSSLQRKIKHKEAERFDVLMLVLFSLRSKQNALMFLCLCCSHCVLTTTQDKAQGSRTLWCPYACIVLTVSSLQRKIKHKEAECFDVLMLVLFSLRRKQNALMFLCLYCSHYEASRTLWCSYACVVLTVSLLQREIKHKQQYKQKEKNAKFWYSYALYVYVSS